MAKKIAFRDRLRASILAAQLEEELENDEYKEPESLSDPGQDGTGLAAKDELRTLNDTLTDTLNNSLPDNTPDWLTNSQPHPLSDQQINSHSNKHTIYQINKRSDRHSSKHSTSHSPSPAYVPTTTDPVMCMTDTQAQILAFLIDNNIQVIKYDELVRSLDIPYGTVRWAIAKLEKENFLSKRKFRKGRIQGIAVGLNETLCKHFYEKRMMGSWGKSLQTDYHTHQHTNRHSEQPTLKPVDTLADSPSPSKIDRQKTNLSIREKILGLSEEDIAFFYPNLHRVGFGSSQLAQILEKLEKVDKEPDKILVSLEYADWELSAGELKDKDGRVVKNPCAFIFSALARTGYYRRPSNFVSAEELAARDMEKQAASLREAREIKEKAEFEMWRQSLGEDELAEIMQARIGPKEQWLWNHFKNQVKKE